MREVTVRAPAKINLHLGVGPVRGDGFHPLATAYQAISLFSTITARPAAEWAITCAARDGVEGIELAGVPLDESNLALRAARLLAERTGITQPVSLHVDKGIPVAGGLAGGSADGAAALRACHELWGLDLSDSDLVEIAAELGSDVPFGLVGGSASGHGRGELVEPLVDTGRYDWVVLTFTEGMSTPAVYHEFDALHERAVVPDPQIPPALVAALAAGSVTDLAGAVGNDLQPASLRLRPALAAPLQAGVEGPDGALAALVSGSGPTCLFLCADPAHAARVAARLADGLAVGGLAVGGLADGGRVQHAHGPVTGATIL